MQQESCIRPKPQDSNKDSDIVNSFSFFGLNNQLFESSKVKKQLTKKQKRESNCCLQEKSLHDLDNCPELPYENYNSKIVFQGCMGCYRRQTLSGVDEQESNIKQLVLPVNFRLTIQQENKICR